MRRVWERDRLNLRAELLCASKRSLEGLKHARFDALISQLYPDSWTHPTTSALLARTYEKIILKGDDELWQEAKRRGPVGIDEWKVAVQEAFVLLRELRARGNP